MTRQMLKMFYLQVMAWIAVIALSGFVALAQDSGQAAVSAAPANETPNRPVTILEDTLIRVMTNEPLNSKRAERGTPVLLTVSEDVFVGDVLAIPRGAAVHGEVIHSKRAGVLTGNPELTFKLVSLNLGGRSYSLDSYQFKVTGTSKTKPTETKALRGAEVGTIVGSLTGSLSSKGGTVDNGSGRVASMTAGYAWTGNLDTLRISSGFLPVCSGYDYAGDCEGGSAACTGTPLRRSEPLCTRRYSLILSERRGVSDELSASYAFRINYSVVFGRGWFAFSFSVLDCA